MCRHAEIALDPTPASARRARVFVRDHLNGWELEELVETAILAVSELVTNAVLHARSSLEVVLAVGGGVCEVGVSDHDRRTPRPRRRMGDPQPPLDDGAPPWIRDGGRGLMLVEACADEWGVADLREGKQVWFRLFTDESWPKGGVCPCGEQQRADVIRLPSGRQVIAC